MALTSRAVAQRRPLKESKWRIVRDIRERSATSGRMGSPPKRRSICESCLRARGRVMNNTQHTDGVDGKKKNAKTKSRGKTFLDGVQTRSTKMRSQRLCPHILPESRPPPFLIKSAPTSHLRLSLNSVGFVS